MLRIIYLLILGGAITTGNLFAEIENLRCEYLRDPLGIAARNPRLSWTLQSDRRGERQTAYQILVASSERQLRRDQGDLWDSGKVVSDETTQISYQGRPLAARQDCFWKVRIWDREGRAGRWSPAAHWTMGLLDPSDWSAKWISARPQAASAATGLRIHRAAYQAAEGNVSVDVTALVASHVKNDRLVLVANNKTLGGDPVRNEPKLLRVDYEIGGERKSKEVRENATLTIPEELSSVPYLRKSFDVEPSVARATLYITALGLYEVHINGQRVGDHLLAPDWTDYRKRVRYQAYDVTPLVKKGPNAMAACLANGWYCGRIGNGGNQFFGVTPALLAQLELTYSDGRTERIVSDASWKSHPSPIASSDFMLGEDHDARRQVERWDRPGLDESQWGSVELRSVSGLALDSQVMEPARQVAEIKPKSVKAAKDGAWIFDLGQNMVGVVRLKVQAPAGTRVTLRHAEMLNPDGTIYTRNLRGAPSVDHYICKGGGVERWQPTFTFHGFQYVEVSGLPAKPANDAVTGIVIASDTPRTGEFLCSDARLNQLQSNIQWGQRGNYLSVPTDCPQRDERLGWMGDAQVFIRTATYNADVAAFFSKWLVDVDDGQSPEGSFSDVCPNTMGSGGTPAWGDAGVICPWTLYEAYGDKQLLEQHLPAMIKWVEFMRARSDGLIRSRDRGSDYGDWLSNAADTPKDLIGTAYFAYSTRLVAEACRVLGHAEEAARYEKLFQEIKEAFARKYVAADGRIHGNTQTAYAMALKFDLLPDELRPKAAQYLAQDVQARNGHLSTGFIGVGYLLPVLADSGNTATAYQLLLQDSFPSWLFSVKHGATTIWERWDGWTPDKGFQDPGMNSFNHYSLGSCGEFLFGYVGGIRPASPGFKKILIDPAIGNDLTWAKTRYESVQGRIATSWAIRDRRLSLDVTVPANTTATVRIPARDASAVTEGGKPAARAEGVKFLRQEDGKALFEVGSGTYRFASEI